MRQLYIIITIAVVAIFSVGPPLASRALALDQWYACHSVADCMAEPGDCGDPVSINKDYLADFLAYTHTKAAAIDCAWNIDPVMWEDNDCGRMVNTHLLCVENRCVFDDDEVHMTQNLKQCIAKNVPTPKP